MCSIFYPGEIFLENASCYRVIALHTRRSVCVLPNNVLPGKVVISCSTFSNVDHCYYIDAGVQHYRSFHGDVIHRVTWWSGISGWQKICGWRASRVFCWDSFPVCPHFTHLQDHDYVLYWCGVHWELCGRLVLFFFIMQKKGKRRKLWLTAFSCKQWGSPS